jgi:hypothetical protein
MRAVQSNHSEEERNRRLPGRAALVQALPMRPLVRVRRPLLCAGMTIFLSQSLAGAAHAENGDHDRWVPSFAVFFDFTGQKAKGSVESGDVLGPPLDPFDDELDAQLDGNGCLVGTLDPVPPPQNPPAPPFPEEFVYTPRSRSNALCTTSRTNPREITADDSGSDTSIAPLVGGSLELMTPSPLDGFLYPRLFVHADYAAAFAFERNLAGTGSPGRFAPPDFFPVLNPDVEELAIQGQGSRSRWQLNRDIWSAGGGIALTTTWFQRTIRIKPSLEWIHFDQDFIGVVHRAVKLKTPSQPQVVQNPGTPDWRAQIIFSDISAFRQIALTRVETHDFDGIGPGLEIEVDTVRLGPFKTSVFALGRGYHLLGDLDQTFTATNEFGETATWTFEPEQWMWRAGVGFRFRWVPESD